MTKISVSGENFQYELPRKALVDLGVVEMISKAEYNRGFDDGYALAKQQHETQNYCEHDAHAMDDAFAAAAWALVNNETNYEKYFGSPEKAVATLTKIGKSYSAMHSMMTCCMCTQKSNFCVDTKDAECQINREAWMRQVATDEPLL